jgi:hypothetical protein
MGTLEQNVYRTNTHTMEEMTKIPEGSSIKKLNA